MEGYEMIREIGKGTYGTVFKCKENTTGEYVAAKQICLANLEDGFPNTLVREIYTLKKLSHPNLVKLRTMVMDKDYFYLIMDCERENLNSFVMRTSPRGLDSATANIVFKQIMTGLAHLHENELIHRDMKPQNILISACLEVKICDFGSCAIKRDVAPVTFVQSHKVISLWYRPLEIILGMRDYSYSCDMWSMGCIFLHLLKGQALFQGENTEYRQFKEIICFMGMPTPKNLGDYYSVFISAPGWLTFSHAIANKQLRVNSSKNQTNLSEYERFALFTEITRNNKAAFDLLFRLLDYNPNRRISAAHALEHAYFKQLD